MSPPYVAVKVRGHIWDVFNADLAQILIEDCAAELVWDSNNPAANYNIEINPIDESEYPN
jgi:hypothetical protein